MSVVLSVDIGGSFTDVALLLNGKIYTAKSPTTPIADRGVLNAIEAVFSQAAISYTHVERFILGTTLATNALLERKGAKTALITSQGFTDIVEIARENRYSQYDINMQRARPLVPRPLRFGVAEKVNYRGELILALDEQACYEVASQLRALNVESVAICLLHGYINGQHEQRIKAILNEVYPDLYISLSSEICPEIREYERTSTVCANAYIQPLISRSIDKLKHVLSAKGLRCPIFLMTSSGSLCSTELAKQEPVKLVESGPAGGAIFATYIAKQCQLDKVIGFDMGGTTAKVSYICDYLPEESRSFEFGRAYRFLKGSGQPIRIPVIELVEIGAGGGSIAHIDNLKRLRVGPESAVSQPGPVCFNLGGLEPTVTDANCVLHYIDPDLFAAGQLKLNPDLAKQVLLHKLSSPLGLDSAEQVAMMINEVVTENMASAARVHGVELGHDVRSFAAIAMGGGGPLHIGRLAQKLGINKIVVPVAASVGSAIGFLIAPIQYHLVKTFPSLLSQLDAPQIEAILGPLKQEAIRQVQHIVNDPQSVITVATGAYMRYKGQGYEIKVNFALDSSSTQLLADIRETFNRAYQNLYHRVIHEVDIEMVTWFVTASVNTLPINNLMLADEPVSTSNAFYEKQLFLSEPNQTSHWVSVKVYDRASLMPGFSFTGPAVVSEKHTTTIVPRGFSVTVNAERFLLIEEQVDDVA